MGDVGASSSACVCYLLWYTSINLWGYPKLEKHTDKVYNEYNLPD
jgi:hypothetical protein